MPNEVGKTLIEVQRIDDLDTINDADFKVIDLQQGIKKEENLLLSIDWLHLDYIKKKVVHEDDHEPSILVVVLLVLEVLDRITTNYEEAFEGIVVQD